MAVGNGKTPKPALAATHERLYPFPDADLGIAGADRVLVTRHLQRYVNATELAHEHLVATGKHWLDIACGSGYGSSVIQSKHPASYTGVDGSQEAIRYARRHFKPDCEHEFQLAELVKWWPRRTVDAVLCIETLEHLPRDEQSTFVQKIMGCLVDGGVVVISCPVHYEPTASDNPFHLHEPTLNEVASYLGTAFRAMHVETVDGTFGEFRQCYAVGVKT